MTLDACFSSGKDDWETPDDLFNDLDAIYRFTIDAAANQRNHKVDRWYGPGGEVEDALSVMWPRDEGNIWLNPPYSRGLQAQFVKKAYDAVRPAFSPKSARVVCLLPARTDTRLFHEIIFPYGEITFLRGRLKFKGAPSSAPFPSMIVVF